jgi:hypothetical protein
MPGTKLAPTASRANFKKHTSIVATGGATIRHSLRDGFNGFLRALPGDRAFCRRRCADRSAQLSISVEMPKPHDFAVRKRRIRLMHLTSIASCLTFRDDSAYAPLAEAGWAESITLFLPRSEAKNFFIHGWTNVRSAAHTRTDLPVGQRGLRPAVGNDAVSVLARTDRCSVPTRRLCSPRSPGGRQAIGSSPGYREAAWQQGISFRRGGDLGHCRQLATDPFRQGHSRRGPSCSGSAG